MNIIWKFDLKKYKIKDPAQDLRDESQLLCLLFLEVALKLIPMNEMLLGNYRVFGWACLAPKRQEITKKVDWEDSFLVSSQEDVMRLLHGFILGSL